MNPQLEVVLRTLIHYPFPSKPEASYAFTIRKIKNANSIIESIGLTCAQFIMRINALVCLGYIKLNCNINDITNKNQFSYKVNKTKEALKYINK